MSFKSVAVIGANGNLGEVVTPLLLNSGLKVTAVTREDSKTTIPTVNVLRTNYSFDSLVSVFQGQDAVLCLVGNTGVQTEITMIDAPVIAGVKWFIPSEYGHDTTDPRVVKMLPMFQEKGAD